MERTLQRKRSTGNSCAILDGDAMAAVARCWRKFLSKAFVTRTPEMKIQAAVQGEGGDMKKVLGAFELTMLGVGAIVGAGVFVLTGVAAKCKAG